MAHPPVLIGGAVKRIPIIRILHTIIFLAISVSALKWSRKLLINGKDHDVMNFMILGVGLTALAAGVYSLAPKRWLKALSMALSVILLAGFVIYAAFSYGNSGWGPYMILLISPFIIFCAYTSIYLLLSKQPGNKKIGKFMGNSGTVQKVPPHN